MTETLSLAGRMAGAQREVKVGIGSDSSRSPGSKLPPSWPPPMRLAWIAGWIVLWLRSVGSATIRLTCSGDLGEEDCAPLTVACLASAIDRARACSATITTDRIGETAAVLDEFLMPRLAWRVVSEPDERAADVAAAKIRLNYACLTILRSL